MNNTLLLMANLSKFLGIAVFISLLGTIAIEAQENPPQLQNSAVNGLFTPTAAQRFYEAGIKDFERKADFLIHPERHLSENILQIDPELIRQIKQNKSFPKLESDRFYLLNLNI